MRCGHGFGVATVVGASHGSDVRLTPRDELSEQQAALVIRSRPNEAAHFFRLQGATGATRGLP